MIGDTRTQKDFKNLIGLYKDVFGNGAGAKLLAEWEKRYTWRSSHVPGDPYSTAFNEGIRFLVTKCRTYVDTDYEELARRAAPLKTQTVFTSTLDEEEIVDGDQ
jgi:hypothetical protein